jgi:hypothetical protein
LFGEQGELSVKLRNKIFLNFFHLGVDSVFEHFFKNPKHFKPD